MDPSIRLELIKNWAIVNEINNVYPKLLWKLADYCARTGKNCKPLCGNCIKIKQEEDKYKQLRRDCIASDEILNAVYGRRGVWASIKVDGYETNEIGIIEIE